MLLDKDELLRKATIRIRQLQSTLEERTQPIAMIGLACRFPEASDKESFWRLLIDGVDAISEIPAARWDIDAYYDPDPDAPGKMSTRYGGFIDGIDRFDSAFFSIAPREAAELDPQQRLLLEVSWHALEDAAIDPRRLAGSRTGVYVGISTNDYSQLMARGGEQAIGPYRGTGTSHSAAAGRLSFALGLEGPSLAIDTACSSSLVALNQACRALRDGDCELALAGGVNAILSPELMIYFSKGRFMAPDGRCKAFDAAADGYVRGEGCGMVVLKRLDHAQRDGDRIYAIIRGSAVNQDGRSGGLTVPNGPAQERLIGEALALAQVEPRDVTYVEAHGTGTPLGDPIEIHALQNVLGRVREGGPPLLVGSVKTNIGHLEAAAGIAGVIKVALSMQAGVIPGQLHFKAPSPMIRWDSINVQVVGEAMPWPAGRRIAGVSSFAFQGTNAHVVLEGPPETPVPRAAEPGDPATHLLAISGATDGALRELAGRYARWLDDHPEANLADVCFTAAAGRSHLSHRAAVVADTRQAIREAMARLAAGESHPAASVGHARTAPKVAMLFTGQGSQYAGMARGLYEEEPAFRRALDRCAAALEGELDGPLLEVLFSVAGGTPTALDETRYAQPALFAVEVALYELYVSLGVEPDAVLGHSVGEFAAAYAAGVVELEDAVRLVARRGRLMGELPAGGAMAAVFADEATVAAEAGGLEVAAYNGTHVVVSGAAVRVGELVSRFERDGVRCVRLSSGHAFHSQLLEPALAPFERMAAAVAWRPPRRALISNLTGQAMEVGRAPDGAYWRRHAREPVRFADGVRALSELGCTVLLELGPRPVLGGIAAVCWQGQGPAVTIAALRPGVADGQQLRVALAQLYAVGVTPDFVALGPAGPRRTVNLPTYPFQRQRCWADLGSLTSPSRGPVQHPLLGVAVRTAGLQERRFEQALSLSSPPWLADHGLRGRAVFPAAAFLETLLACLPEPHLRLEHLVIERPLVFARGETHWLQTVVQTPADGPASMEIYSQLDGDSGWRRHARAAWAAADPSSPDPVNLRSIRDRCRRRLRSDPWYRRLARLGLTYGPAFRTLRRLYVGLDDALARVEVDPSAADGADAYRLMPPLLDGCLQAIVAASPARGVYLPVAIQRVQVWRPAGTTAWCHVVAGPSSRDDLRADLRLLDDGGRVVADLEGVHLRRASRRALRRSRGGSRAAAPLYRIRWRDAPPPPPPAEPLAAGTWLLLGDPDSLGPIAERLAARGQHCVTAAGPEGLPPAGAPHSLCGVVVASRHRPGDDPPAVALAVCTAVLELAGAMLAGGIDALPGGLWLLTERAVAADPAEAVDPAQAAVWGLGLAIAVERPGWGCRLLDGDGDQPADPWRLVDRLLSVPAEPQWAVRGDRWLVPRLVARRRSEAPPAAGGYRLGVARRGRVDSLRLEAHDPGPPGPGEVRVAVEAAGLNFRDVLNVLGLYPGDPGPLGAELAGTVAVVGPDVDSLRVGDRVFGPAAGAIASAVNCPAAALAVIPPGLDSAAAAAAPIAFCTALRAFELAALRPGDRVLVHAAAGGVGLAAVQLARAAGAEIFATASQPKHGALRALGIERVYDSRSIEFAGRILDDTAGAGVDVVLNSLTGEGFVEASLSALAPGGRFVEIAKRGIWPAERMAAARPDVAYHILALDEELQRDPASVGAALRRVADRLANGELWPLPARVYPLAEAAAAFRYMEQARQLGKITLIPPAAFAVRADATYLITGGTGALGLQTAAWLAGRGARQLVLVARRLPGEETTREIAAIRGGGCAVEVISADVGRADEVARVLDRIRDDLPPLRGIIHAAGAIDDAALGRQGPERLGRAMAPKAAGAWHLHEQTRDRPLDFFVLYSSASSVLGSAGQANYTAANAFLDGLAQRRRAAGLPALSVDWGPWAGGGMAADRAVQARLRAQGIQMLEPTAAFRALSSLLASGVSQGVVLRADWTRWARSRAEPKTPPLLAEWFRPAPSELKPTFSALRQQLVQALPAQRRAMVVEHLGRQVREVLSLAAPPDPTTGFFELGMDSLMAVELAYRLRAQLGLESALGSTALFDHPTVAALADHMLAGIADRPRPVAPTRRRRPIDREPIAVVGLACRFPGAPDPEAFWRLLAGGADAIIEVPPDRWDINAYYDPDHDAPGKMATRYGGFVEQIDGFDPQFFGIAPREAAGMDPQQRLLLECAWEALEYAGIAPDRLLGSPTGVFVGLSTTDYTRLQELAGHEQIDAYLGIGTAHSAAAGRLSYLLGLEGPNLAIDTACSSSLVAVGQACDALRWGRCDLAIAGGANALLTPDLSIAFTKARMLAADGRCKVFDAAADGYVRSEGCGLVVLKRLDDARRDGDQILAIVRGAAVNQDGRSSGLTVPNGPAQQRVIAAALEQAGVAPGEVDYLEAHGTGTSLGDPIEVHAAAAVLGEGREASRPLLIGSVKTNVGHLEAAAGIAGLIKVILAMRHGTIPRHLHFRDPSPHIPWDRLHVRVVAEPTPWPSSEGRRPVAGISSFGFSGTNAHVVLEGPPAAPAVAAAPELPPRSCHLLGLSGRDEAALPELARRYRAWLRDHPEADLADICYTAGVGRSHFDHRAAVVVDSGEQATEVLEALECGRAAPGLFVGRVARPKVAWLFTGQGGQYPGMSRRLYESQPAFRETLDQCASLLSGELPVGLLDVLFGMAAGGNGRGPLLNRTRYAQPALFAVGVSLARMYESWGLRPDAVMGHSVGEYAAACVAGVFTLEEGLRLIARRGRLMDDLPDGGMMAAVFAPAARVAAAIAPIPMVSLAAENGAQAVISGPAEAVAELVRRFESEGLRCAALATSHAFHSALLDPMLDTLESAAAEVAYRLAEVPLVSNLSGQVLGADERLDASYWRRHAREPVRFARGVATLAELGCGVLLEMGPQPVLAGLATACWPGESKPPVVSALRRGADDDRQTAETLARLYVQGITPEFSALHRPWPRRKLALPTYPFQRQRYWVQAAPSRPTSPGRPHDRLLGHKHELAGGDWLFTTTIGLDGHPWLADHVIYNNVVVPGATYAAMACHAAGVPCHLGEVVFHEPLILPDRRPQPLQVRLIAADEDGRRRLEIHSRPAADESAWVLHASGLVEPAAPARAVPRVVPETEVEGLPPLPVEHLFADFASLGLELGPAFRSLQRIWIGPEDAWAELAVPEALRSHCGDEPIHPAVLDACTQLVGAWLGTTPDGLYLPLQYQSVRLDRAVPERFWCRSRPREANELAQTSTYDLTFFDGAGLEFGRVNGFVIKRAPREALLRGSRSDANRLLYQIRWLECPPIGPSTTTGDATSGSWLICGAGAEELGEPLGRRGLAVQTASSVATIADAPGGDPPPTGVVWLAGSGAIEAACAEVASTAARELIAPLVELVQGLLARGLDLPDGLTIVTRRAMAAEPGEVVAPLQASLWGLGRSLALEHPELNCRLLDVDSEAPPLAEWLLAPDRESQGALRNGRLLVPRLVPRTRAGLLETPGGDYRLAAKVRGRMESLVLEAAEVSLPGEGEVQVDVEAAGLNFRDVLNALGAYPRNPGPLGCELAGVISEVGAGVTYLRRGDRVLGLATGGLASRVNIPAALLCLRPEGMGAVEGATIPVTFCTAAAAFDLAGLRPGERVLIHAAAGGVGLAAVQLAQAIGAEVYATANAGKQATLRALGVEHLYDSRSTEFADRILADTGGAGVQVVLNSLTSPGYIASSLRALGPGGRFVEIGKIDIWTVEEMRAARRDVAYHIFALDDWMVAEPKAVGAMLAGVVARMAADELRPLPSRVYPLAEAPAAFRWMQQARHVGKIVLTIPRPQPRRDGGYLITGGLGALGLASAEWLAGQSAGCIVLMGRRGPGLAEQECLERLEEKHGCTIHVVSADVSDAAAVAQVLRRFGGEWPTLRGVIHAAGILDDGVVPRQGWTRFEAVLKPKALGAWHLHEQTQGLPIDFFVLYSSVAAVLGSAGQVNYAAANAFLDGLAQHRRSLGLPALSVNWGPWSERGMAADRGVQARMRGLGLEALKPDVALEALSSLLASGTSQAAVVIADWPRWGRSLPGEGGSPFLAELLGPRSIARGKHAPAALPFLQQASAAQREAMLIEHLQQEVQRVLSLSQPPSPRTGFFDLGMDSLMAVELTGRLQRALGTGSRLSSTALFDYPTVAALAAHINAKLSGTLRRFDPVRSDRPFGDEPIAVVGLACRLPGAADVESFWRLLEGGVDAIAEVPPDRWDVDAYYDPDPDAPGRMGSRWGGFVERIDGFDPQFFGISPREAISMDPQQRLLLECVWEALENAGIAPASLETSDTGVFVGISTNDYLQLMSARDESSINSYLGTGSAHSAAVGRISYILGLEGPSLAIDTACSSSLVAVGQACDALRLGECGLALAGGVNAILSPELTIAFTKARMLSPNGRCRTFDSAADGYVRGEGCGVVVLKRLSDARRYGDRILAVIRGHAVNQDGRSSGLTVPNGPAQERVIRGALERAGIEPGEVDYLEAHGTGTSLGDPIEVRAAAAVLGEGREASRPLLIGSVKTNIGHLEAAAGIAGLIKVILAMQHGLMPRHLNFDDPSPHIPWDRLPVQVVRDARPWPSLEGRLPVAGVSSFGFSGTNAHVVLEGPPEPTPEPDGPNVGGSHVLCLSARSEKALAELAGRYRDWLEAHPEAELAAVCYTAGAGRSHHEHRAAVVMESAGQAIAALDELRGGGAGPGVARGRAGAVKVAWIFPGEGSVYPGMARGLYESQPAFREVIDRCAAALAGELPVGLLEALFGSGAAANGSGPLLGLARYAQPALFAVEVGLARLYASWGLRPDAVLGYGEGEYAAACVAGVFEPEDGVRLVARRGRLMDELAGGGRMAAVFEPAGRAAAPLGDNPHMALAADNREHAVISGCAEAVDAAVRRFGAEGLRCEDLGVGGAAHSPVVESILEELEAAASAVACRATGVAWVSSVTGGVLPAEVPVGGAYWRRQAREPVRFAEGVRSLRELGCTVLLELGPRPVLGGMAVACWPGSESPAVIVALRPGVGDEEESARSLAELYVSGASPNFVALAPAGGRRKVGLPTYPFQRQRYWIDSPKRRGPAGRPFHPLLGVKHTSARGEVTYDQTMSLADQRWLADHRVFDTVVAPGALYACMVMATSARPIRLLDGQILQALSFQGGDEPQVQLTVQPSEAEGHRLVEVFSRTTAAGDWSCHARCRIAKCEGRPEEPVETPDVLSSRLSERDIEAFYARLAMVGIEYGPRFSIVTELYAGEGEAFGVIETPAELVTDGIPLHPATLDGCWQVAGAALDPSPFADPYVPFAWEQLDLFRDAPARLYCHVRLRGSSSETIVTDLWLMDDEGLVGRIAGLAFRRASRRAMLADRDVSDDWTYEVRWLESPLAGHAAPDELDTAHLHANGRNGYDRTADASARRPGAALNGDAEGLWVFAADRRGIAKELAGELFERRQACVVVEDGESFESIGRLRYRLRFDAAEDWQRLFGQLPAQPSLRGVVHLSALDVAERQTATVRALGDDVRHAGASLLAMVQALVWADVAPTSGVWLITCGAQSTDDGESCPGIAASTAWGMARTVALEHPELNCRRIDVDDPVGQIGALVDELLGPDEEDQIARRGPARLAARLVRLAIEAARLELPAGGRYRLAKGSERTPAGLHAEPLQLPPPGPGEVQVAVHAAGLNFRDLLDVLGMYPGDAGPLGQEMAGRVVAIGEGVDDFAVGDRVVGLGGGSFSDRSNLPANLLARTPSRIGDLQAATLPVAFTTAQIAFELAGLRPKERVLIHAAAGGVGLAAVQIAQALGAEVFATASRSKQSYLRSLGIQHVYDSRSIEFADRILADTAGAGVDVVLNSLTSEGFIEASLRGLASGGRFIEIGKRGIWTPEQMQASRADVAYHILAVDHLIELEPRSVGEALRRVVARVEAGDLRPLRHRAYPLSQVPAAMRTMQQARLIGKIVLTVPDPTGGSLRPDRTYLITGGLSGIGLEVARWLANEGARSIALNGRREPGEAARRLLGEMRDQGIDVRVFRADLGVPEQVEHMLGEIDDSMPHLAGVFHCAGVLRDGALVNQTWERFEEVLTPKALGGWALHRLAEGRDLDLFVLFGSTTGVLGNPGQANHAAANALLDQLARHRRAMGLPAVAIDWGAWSGVGEAAERADQLRDRLAAAGVGWIDPPVGLRALGRALAGDRAQVAVAPIDWPRYVGRLGGSPLLRSLPSAAPTPKTASTGSQLLRRVRQAPAEQGRQLLIKYLVEQVRRVLQLDEPPSIRTGFFDLGMDSLMAVELRDGINADLQLEPPLSSAAMFDHATIEALAVELRTRLGVDRTDDGDGEPSDGPSIEPKEFLRNGHEPDIALISESEAEEFLLRELLDLESAHGD